MHTSRRGELHMKGFPAQLFHNSKPKYFEIPPRINLIPARLFPYRLLGKEACWISRQQLVELRLLLVHMVTLSPIKQSF